MVAVGVIWAPHHFWLQLGTLPLVESESTNMWVVPADNARTVTCAVAVWPGANVPIND